MEEIRYIAPEIEIIELVVEQGLLLGSREGGGAFNVPDGGNNDGGWL